MKLINQILNRFMLLVGALIFLPAWMSAQTPTFQDCLGAIPVCLNSYSTSSVITGTGNIPNEINAVNSCLLTGERNDAWYIITTGTSGNLNFSIIPNNPAHNYDWAIYNLTSAVCSSIFTNPGLEVGCNYSNLPGTTGANGLIGAQNNPVISVSAGQTYLLNVSGFSTIQQSGYTIDLGSSTAAIVDNTTPVLSGINAMNCGATNINISFSERVLCNSVQPSDFTLTGPGGPYTISSVNSTSCTAGATYSRDYAITFSPALQTAGLYTMSLVNSVTDNCGNNSIVPQNFPVPISGVGISFQKVDVTCFGGNNGSATTTITGPPGPYTYQWSPSGGSGPSAQWLIAGTYTVTVTTPLGCSASASVVINQPLTGLTATASVNPSNGCAANGSATVTVTSGQAPFTYSWWPTGGNGPTASNLTAGSYMVTVTDANQCALNYFLSVPSASGPTVNISNFENISCHGGNDGTATVAVTGATGPFTYQWSPSGGNAATANGLTAGNYSVAVIIAPGCTLTASVSLSEPPQPLTTSVTSTNTSCGNHNGSINVTANGGAGSYSYQWSPNVSTGNAASGLSGGTYTVTVTDGNGCTKQETVSIVPSSQPVLTLSNHHDVSCFGLSDGSTGVTVAGGTLPLTAQWTSGQSTYLINNIQSGTYTITVTDALGCVTQLTDVIQQPTQLTATLQNVQHVKCFGDSTGSASITTSGGNGGNTWSWLGTTSSNAFISGVPAGNYTATVSDQNGCSAFVPVVINQPASALSISGTITATTCGNNDGAITTTITGGTSPYSYLWSSGSTTPSINSLFPGIYTLTVTDQNNCQEIKSFTVQASNAPVIAVISSTNVQCFGGNDGSAALSVSGGTAPYSWLWQGNISTGTSASGMQAGIYNVTVTDASGCQSFEQVTITQPAQLQVQLSQPVTICIGETTNVTAFPAGGSQPYVYAWNTGAIVSQLNVTPVVSTSYSITVTDAHGCTVVSSPVTVTVQSPMNISVSAPDSVCKGMGAQVIALVTGGNGTYNYIWSNGLSGANNTLTIQNDTAFTIIVTDGCSTPSVSADVAITALEPPNVNFIIPLQSGCEPFDASFELPAGLPSGLNYLWNFGDGYTSSQLSPIHTYRHEGLYTVSLTISFGSIGSCSTMLQFPNAVLVKPVPVARFFFDPPAPTRYHPDVYFTDHSTGAASWTWNFGDNSPEIHEQNIHHVYADTGTYVVSLKIQSHDGCMDSTFNEVPVKDELQVFIPNAFSPNGSGTNDYFNIYGVGFTSYELYIFDRWGKQVHYAKNNGSAWDGTDDITGEPVPQGLYVYKVSFKDNAGNIHDRINHVTVIR